MIDVSKEELESLSKISKILDAIEALLHVKDERVLEKVKQILAEKEKFGAKIIKLKVQLEELENRDKNAGKQALMYISTDEVLKRRYRADRFMQVLVRLKVINWRQCYDLVDLHGRGFNG